METRRRATLLRIAAACLALGGAVRAAQAQQPVIAVKVSIAATAHGFDLELSEQLLHANKPQETVAFLRSRLVEILNLTLPVFSFVPAPAAGNQLEVVFKSRSDAKPWPGGPLMLAFHLGGASAELPLSSVNDPTRFRRDLATADDWLAGEIQNAIGQWSDVAAVFQEVQISTRVFHKSAPQPMILTQLKYDEIGLTPSSALPQAVFAADLPAGTLWFASCWKDSVKRIVGPTIAAIPENRARHTVCPGPQAPSASNPTSSCTVRLMRLWK